MDDDQNTQVPNVADPGADAPDQTPVVPEPPMGGDAPADDGGMPAEGGDAPAEGEDEAQ